MNKGKQRFAHPAAFVGNLVFTQVPVNDAHLIITYQAYQTGVSCRVILLLYQLPLRFLHFILMIAAKVGHFFQKAKQMTYVISAAP